MNPLTLSTLESVKHYTNLASRVDLCPFIKATMLHYDWGWFNRYLCYRLQQFYEDYQAGNNPRLMVFAPPRSGKTELVSRRFPCWILGRDPALEVMACSYSSDLTNRTSRDCQRVISGDNYKPIFPNTNINAVNRRHLASGAVRTAEYWEVMQGDESIVGSYRSAGVTGGITGQGFNIGIIDDPVKGRREAISRTYQKAIKEWFDSDFMTRRNPVHNGILLIMTRWSKEDLAGKLLEEMQQGGEQWEILSFPMEATKKEVVEYKGEQRTVRKEGDILFPERMPPAFVEQCKKSKTAWSSLYQQNPTEEGGNFFPVTKFKYYNILPPSFKRVIIVGDTAQKKGRHNDFSVFQAWGLYESSIYLLTQTRARLFSYELLSAARDIWSEWGGGTVGRVVKSNAIYIEDKVSGTGLIQDLRVGGYDRRDKNIKHPGIPCIAIQRNVDKALRAYDTHPFIDGGQVYLPENAPWLNEYLIEFEDFTLEGSHAHDDQVDTTMDAVDILLRNKHTSVDYSGY